MATKKKAAKKKFVYRSAETGKIVTKKFADANPKTTLKDTIFKPKILATVKNVNKELFLKDTIKKS